VRGYQRLQLSTGPPRGVRHQINSHLSFSIFIRFTRYNRKIFIPKQTAYYCTMNGIPTAIPNTQAPLQPTILIITTLFLPLTILTLFLKRKSILPGGYLHRYNHRAIQRRQHEKIRRVRDVLNDPILSRDLERRLRNTLKDETLVQEEMAAFRRFVSRWEGGNTFCDVTNIDGDIETKSEETKNRSHTVKSSIIDEYDNDKSKGEFIQYRGKIIVPWIRSMNAHLCLLLGFTTLIPLPWVLWNALDMGIHFGIFVLVLVHFFDNRILYNRIVRDSHEKRCMERQRGEDCGDLMLVEGIPLASPVSVVFVV